MTGFGSRIALTSSPFASSARRGRDHLEPGRLQEPGLGVLRVERAAREAAARREPHDDRDRHALAVVELGRDVHELVEAAGDEVGELHLADRPHALDRRADGGADDQVLGQRRVEHALGAELLVEAGGHLEGAAEDADVLAQAEHALVAAHLLAQPVGDRLEVGHLAHRTLPFPIRAVPPVRPGRLAVAERLPVVGEHAVRSRCRDRASADSSALRAHSSTCGVHLLPDRFDLVGR